MDKVFRLTILIIIPLIWFALGTIMLVQSSRDFEDLDAHTGEVERIWTDISNNVKGRPSDILLFKMQGLDQIVGIHHSTIKDYDFYLDRIKPRDRITIYFDREGEKTFEDYNLHIYQLEKDGEVLLDKERRKKTSRNVGLILYGVGLIFSMAPIWYYRKNMRT